MNELKWVQDFLIAINNRLPTPPENTRHGLVVINGMLTVSLSTKHGFVTGVFDPSTDFDKPMEFLVDEVERVYNNYIAYFTDFPSASGCKCEQGQSCQTCDPIEVNSDFPRVWFVHVDRVTAAGKQKVLLGTVPGINKDDARCAALTKFGLTDLEYKNKVAKGETNIPVLFKDEKFYVGLHHPYEGGE